MNAIQDAIIALDLARIADEAAITILAAPRSIVIGAAAWCNPSGGHTRSEDHWIVAASANTLIAPIILPTGAIISAYAVIADKATDNSNTISYRLYSCDTAGVVAAETPGSSNAGNAPHFSVAFGESALAITVLATKSYWLRFTPGGGASPSTDLLYHARIDLTP